MMTAVFVKPANLSRSVAHSAFADYTPGEKVGCNFLNNILEVAKINGHRVGIELIVRLPDKVAAPRCRLFFAEHFSEVPSMHIHNTVLIWKCHLIH